MQAFKMIAPTANCRGYLLGLTLGQIFTIPRIKNDLVYRWFSDQAYLPKEAVIALKLLSPSPELMAAPQAVDELNRSKQMMF